MSWLSATAVALRDHVAREQRQLHARPALGDAVAHRRHAAGDLRGGAQGACRGADARRIVLEGLVRRKHVVVGADDAQVRHHAVAQRLAVPGHAGEAVREVGAAELAPLRAVAARGGDALQVGGARARAARADAFGDGDAGRVAAAIRAPSGCAAARPAGEGARTGSSQRVVAVERAQQHARLRSPRSSRTRARARASRRRQADALRPGLRDRRRAASIARSLVAASAAAARDAREQRRGMAVLAHAEHGDRAGAGAGWPAHAVLERVRRQFHRFEARAGGAFLQQGLAHQAALLADRPGGSQRSSTRPTLILDQSSAARANAR
jgi:hypothetical protein